MLEQSNNSSEQNKASQDARRSFLKKAAIGAPIVIASSTKPAWGAACMSGIMSGNISNHTHTCDLQGGLSHGHWKNHWIGKSKKHFVGNKKKDADNNKNPFKPEFEDYKYHYYVKYGQTYHISPYKRWSKLDGVKFKTLLETGLRYEREIVTAIISASMSTATPPIDNFFPYSIEDVLDIHDLVTANPDKIDEVTDLLEGIHQGAVHLDPDL